MAASYPGSIKIAMRNIRTTIGSLVLLGGLAFLTGCPDSTSKPEPPKAEAKIFVDEAPLVLSPLNENGPEVKVTLPYTSKDGVVPAYCEVTALSKVIASSCRCTEGICTVGIRPESEAGGNGSFDFRFASQNMVWSNYGKARVKILEVTLSIDSGDKQSGIVGTALPKPIVVLVKNSDGVPVPGVKIFWSVKEKQGDREEGDKDGVVELRKGQLSSCKMETDEKGRAQCASWTLGTRQPVLTNQEVNVSAFYEYEDDRKYRDDEDNKKVNKKQVTFSATANPGPAVSLSFFSQSYSSSPYTMYVGPFQSTELDDYTQKLDDPLGGKDGVWVFSIDQYGNAVPLREGEVVPVTLTLTQKPEGGAFVGATPETVSSSMVTTPVNRGKDGPIWSQGVAAFKGLKVTKKGVYNFKASAPGFKEVSYGPFLVENHE